VRPLVGLEGVDLRAEFHQFILLSKCSLSQVIQTMILHLRIEGLFLHRQVDMVIKVLHLDLQEQL